MIITSKLVLPADVTLTPVKDLPPDMQSQIGSSDDEFAVTRPRSRRPSSVVTAESAELLREFRESKTVVNAVIHFSKARNLDPEETLEDAFPLIQRLLAAGILVRSDSPLANEIVASLKRNDRICGYRVVRSVQVLEDSELYQVRGDGGDVAALKIAQESHVDSFESSWSREVAVLQHLSGRVNPTLIESGTHERRPFLITPWHSGSAPFAVAEELRHLPLPDARKSLLELCVAILDSYAHLHDQGVVHGDVHPNNILVASDGSIRILDFGLARIEGASGDVPRGGIGHFLEPEYAAACATSDRPPRSTRAGDQYALAGLIYHLLSGEYYLDFSLDRKEMLGQIVADEPRSFDSLGMPPWKEVEIVLRRALRKNPAERFPSVADFRDRLRAAHIEVAQHAINSDDFDFAPRELLDRVLDRLAPSSPLELPDVSSAPKCSVFFGAAGVAYTLLRIARSRNDAETLALADVWCGKAKTESQDDDAFENADLEITKDIVGDVAFQHCKSGVHLVQALISYAMGDLASLDEAVAEYLASVSAPCADRDLTIGRSSVLLGCSLLVDIVPGHEELRRLGDSVMRSIWEEVNQDRGSLGAGSTYLGMAHGLAGMAYAAMQWCQTTGEDFPRAVQDGLRYLTDCGEPIGRGIRWPVRTPGETAHEPGHYMSGWCHGSAGYVFLWTLAHKMTHDPRYLELAESAAWNVWETRNTLGSLCCGLSGQAYALLNLYRHTDSRDWLNRARQLALRAACADPPAGFPQDSLYKGELGVAVLAADLSNPRSARMPLFEREGWR